MVNIDEVSLREAERIAAVVERSVEQVLSDVVRSTLNPVVAIVGEDGYPVLPLRPGEKPSVTPELVRRIRDSE